MLFSNIDRNTQYVPKIYTWAAHRLSNHTSALFKALQRSFPPAPHGVDVAEVGFCMNELMQICVDQEEICKRAKVDLSAEWESSVLDLLVNDPSLRLEDTKTIFIHVRGGDMKKHNKGVVSTGFDVYPLLSKHLINRSKIQSITISTELEEDTVFVKQELAPLIMKSIESNISYITGGDPVSTWIYMTQVDLLVIGPSSFSLSAAAARSTKPSFSIEQRPKDGRYDDNTLPCSIDLESMHSLPDDAHVGKVYYEVGHGRDKCEYVHHGEWLP